MTNAFLWGLLAAASLIVGGLLGIHLNLGKRTLGIIMGFGAGVLISAVAYELVYEAIHTAKQTGFPTLGLFAGAATFFVSDRIVGRLGAANRKEVGGAVHSSLVIPLVLGIILDGLPESMVIGLGIWSGGTVSIAMLIAVFVSNLPEAIVSTVGMRSGGWSKAKILLLWTAIAVICGAASAVGFAIAGDLSPEWLAFYQTFAGGAMLMMLANTMMPEAYAHGGKLAGAFTVLGFAVAIWIVVLEHSG